MKLKSFYIDLASSNDVGSIFQELQVEERKTQLV